MTTFTKRMAAMLMMLCLLVSLVIPAAAAPSSTIVVTTATGYTAAADVKYNITDGIVANWGARGEVSTFLSSYASDFYTSGYTYGELSSLSGGTTSTAPSSALYTKLQTLMVNNHSFFTQYSGSGSADSRQLYKYTDCVSGDTSKVSLLYLGTLVDSTWVSNGIYNQEHVWPNSKCIGTDSTDVGDIMHLRAADPTENSTRGNKAYGESSGYFDPGVSVRGDCARTLLYMYTRWGNTGNMWGTDGVIESLDILLKWIEEDPVDTWEMGHNDSVQSITGTRNVFIDYPEFAFLLFNEAVPADLVTPSGSGTHNHSFSTTVTAPTCTEQGYTTYTCGCGANYVSTYTTALGHDFVSGTCTACGEKDTTDYVATLVTNASDLRVGDQIVIVADGYAYAMSTTQNSNNRGQADVTVSDDGTSVTFPKDTEVQIITLESGTVAGTFAFNVGTGYLYAASSGSNYLKTETTLSANSSWAISIADGIATVKAQGSNTRNWMRYNTSSKIFAAYGSGQNDIKLYVIDDGQADVCQHDYSSTTINATCTADGVTTYTCDLCGDTYTEVIPATGHNYVGGKCTGCGEAEPAGNIWTKVALGDITATDVIAITMTKDDATWALYNGNGSSASPTVVDVTVNGSTMTSEDVDSIAWNIASDATGLIIYVNGSTATWLYSNNSNSGVRVGTNANKYWVLDADSGYLKHVVTGRYMGVYNAQDWRAYTNVTTNIANQTLSFWKLNAGGSTECSHSYKSVVTAPTYNTDGYTTHTCTVCGHSYVDSIVPATGFALAGANTVLGGVLDMNFFINPADLTGTDYYAEITLYTEDSTVTATVPYADWEVRTDYLVVTQKGLAARQMADNIEVVIYNGDGTQASFLWSDSIRSYVMRVLEKQTDETKTMLVDMLNYGAAAQNFFSYNVDDLANNQLSDAQKAYATETVTCTDQSVKGEGYYGSSLVLKDRILMTVYFNNITPDMYAIVSFTDHKGVVHETRVEGSEFSKYNSTTYGVVVDELVVADGDRLVTVTVYDADGNVVASGSDSVNSYAARQMGKDALYEMVAKFTNSAYAYFH